MNTKQVNSNNVVLTTLFDMKWDFIVEFFNSLSLQDYKDFDVLVVNDGFEKLDLIKRTYRSLNIIELEGVNCISMNRQHLINTAKKFYTKGIFCDADDYFSANRVGLSISLLNDYEIVVNDLDILFNQVITEKSYFSNELSNKAEIRIECILEKNYFGLSNTAINLSCIDPVFFDNRLKVVDWYFFTNLLLNEKRAVFTNETKTYYRQHSDNLAGIGNRDYEQILKEVSVKKMHYQLMSEVDSKFVNYVQALNQYIARISRETDSKREFQVRMNTSHAWWSLINLNLKW